MIKKSNRSAALVFIITVITIRGFPTDFFEGHVLMYNIYKNGWYTYRDNGGCRVLYFSVHRYEYGTFWPNLRQSDYDFIGGRGNGRGYNINVPLNKVCSFVSVCLSAYA